MLAIVDYGMGNIASVRNALKLLRADPVITGNDADFRDATHIILPGVGSFADGMKELRERGLTNILKREVLEKKKPFLGICLGMQLLASTGEEGGHTEGLGFIDGRARHLKVDEKKYRLPHIGWDTITHKVVPIFEGVPTKDFYFVNSYVLEPKSAKNVIATCTYGEKFVAAVQRENIYGVQFHPEKSQASGLAFLKNFISLV